jgi:hypothetical protein
VRTLPSAQGNVPLYVDTLSWSQISSLLFEWAEVQKFPLLKKIPRALADIRSPADVAKYAGMAAIYGRRLAARLWRSLGRFLGLDGRSTTIAEPRGQSEPAETDISGPSSSGSAAP